MKGIWAMNIRRYSVIAAGALALCVATASGDVVTLTDGSTLLGTVTRMGDGKLILETQFAGTLEIDSTMVVTIATDETVNVGVDTGDRLVGQIEWKKEIDRAVVQTELGGIPVAVERISAIWPQYGKSPERLALEAQIEEVKQAREAARSKWSATFEIGILSKEGNSDEFTARGKMEARRKSLKDLLRLYVSGDYGETGGTRDTAEAIGGVYYEYLATKRFFGYGRIEMEYDEFENIELRLSTSLGVGYYWIKEDWHELKTRAGVGYLHETYLPDWDEDGKKVLTESLNTMQGELGVDYRLDVTPWMQFVHGTTYYPTFKTIRDYRLNSDTGFIFPLGDGEVWKLKLGAEYEYKSIPIGDAERLDQTYYANILLDLK